jgi:hypothetical protein
MKIRFASLVKRLSLSLALYGMALCGVMLPAAKTTLAQEGDALEPARVSQASATTTPPSAPQPVISAGEITATPEMWFYEQALRRYDDPKYAIRAVAQQKAAQRRSRLAAQAWYGYSNSRPASGIDPTTGPLQPQWIGNGYDPYTWAVPGGPSTLWVLPGLASGN